MRMRSIPRSKPAIVLASRTMRRRPSAVGHGRNRAWHGLVGDDAVPQEVSFILVCIWVYMHVNARGGAARQARALSLQRLAPSRPRLPSTIRRSKPVSTITNYQLLVTSTRRGIGISNLADVLVMDRTTLTRNLQPLLTIVTIGRADRRGAPAPFGAQAAALRRLPPLADRAKSKQAQARQLLCMTSPNPGVA